MHPEILWAVAAARREELLADADAWHRAKRHGRQHARRWLLLSRLGARRRAVPTRAPEVATQFDGC